MANVDARLKALETDNADLEQTVAQLRAAVRATKEAVQAKFDTIALPMAPWMHDVENEMRDKLRLHHVADLRKVSKGKLKKLGVTREEMNHLRDYVTTPRAQRVKRANPWQSDEACWYEAQAMLWGAAE